jgi:hypothetical protein
VCVCVHPCILHLHCKDLIFGCRRWSSQLLARPSGQGLCVVLWVRLDIGVILAATWLAITIAQTRGKITEGVHQQCQYCVTGIWGK